MSTAWGAPRYVQLKGLLAAHLVHKVEEYARKSRDLDPDFHGGSATRLIGTLYVLAPAALLEHGDSETGLDTLEKLVKAHPEALENHLRVAEAYISLGDPDPAKPHLCLCMRERDKLRNDDQALLRHLLSDTGGKPCGRDANEGKGLSREVLRWTHAVPRVSPTYPCRARRDAHRS